MISLEQYNEKTVKKFEHREAPRYRDEDGFEVINLDWLDNENI